MVDADNGQGAPIHYDAVGALWQNWPSASTTIDSSDSLVNQVKRYDGNFNLNWRYKVQKEGCGWVDMKNPTTSHTLYQVFAIPKGAVEDFTKEHIKKACEMADGADSKVAVADAIHNAIGDPVDPPYDPGEQSTLASGWDLLDNPNTYGECDEQAALMKDIVELLGLTATVEKVRASTNAGPGNCLDLETQILNEQNRKEWLLLDFDPTETGAYWNSFEACCVTADFYYAVWPKLKATDDYDILKQLIEQLGCQQYWVLTYNDKEPDKGPGVEIAFVPPVPLPELD